MLTLILLTYHLYSTPFISSYVSPLRYRWEWLPGQLGNFFLQIFCENFKLMVFLKKKSMNKFIVITTEDLLNVISMHSSSIFIVFLKEWSKETVRITIVLLNISTTKEVTLYELKGKKWLQWYLNRNIRESWGHWSRKQKNMSQSQAWGPCL